MKLMTPSLQDELDRRRLGDLAPGKGVLTIMDTQEAIHAIIFIGLLPSTFPGRGLREKL